MGGFYDIEVRGIDGSADLLGGLRGKVVLAVNVASRCGLTPQYTGLEQLHRDLREQNFSVVGFPCNQFGAQEPGDAAEIANFCSLTYDVDFPMMRKIDVNGPKAHPLYAYLQKAKKGVLGTEAIKWNFTKFLVDRTGQVTGRFPPTAEPQALEGAIEALL
jgi:glutathione peroxidase